MGFHIDLNDIHWLFMQYNNSNYFPFNLVANKDLNMKEADKPNLNSTSRKGKFGNRYCGVGNSLDLVGVSHVDSISYWTATTAGYCCIFQFILNFHIINFRKYNGKR